MAYDFKQGCKDGLDSMSFVPIGNFNCYTASGYTPNGVQPYQNMVNMGWNWCRDQAQSSGPNDLTDAFANMRSARIFDEFYPGWRNVTTHASSVLGNETPALYEEDEPSSFGGSSYSMSNYVRKMPNSIQDTRPWSVGLQHQQLNCIGGTPGYTNSCEGDTGSQPMSHILQAPMTTPNGNKRSTDGFVDVDVYWFDACNCAYESQNTNSTHESNGPFETAKLYKTPDKPGQPYAWLGDVYMRCGCRYGDTVDYVRQMVGSSNNPVLAYVELGGPGGDNPGPYTSSMFIHPWEMNWAAWSNFVHGARGLLYFDTYNSTPTATDLPDNCFGCLNNASETPASQGGTGQPDFYAHGIEQTRNNWPISMEQQVVNTDKAIKAHAVEINSPEANHYVSTNLPSGPFPCHSMNCIFGSNGASVGIEQRAVYVTDPSQCNGQSSCFYIIADPRADETTKNINVTFTIAGRYTGPIKDLCSCSPSSSASTVNVANHQFTDRFANAWDVHIYGPIPNQ